MKIHLIPIAILMYSCVLVSSPMLMAKNQPKEDCHIFFMAVEHDEETSNLNMVGLDHPQREWFEKHGRKEVKGFCVLNGNATGLRITAEAIDEKYIDNIVGNSPLYSVAWEQHRVLVPDDQGGHYAVRSTGILSVWDRSGDRRRCLL